MHVPVTDTRWKVFHDGFSSSLIAVISLVRGLFLFLSGRPRTLLRVLCIVAFDTCHKLRNGKWLSILELKKLATFLDFGACANAAFDHKVVCLDERRVTLQLLEEAGMGVSVADYFQRLDNLERGRPLPGGDRSQFQNVCLYREDVVRLSLGMVAIATCGNQCLDEAIEKTYGEGDLNLLFRIVMLCQIIDDVLDYPQDRSIGLPSFLTACKPLPLALELTQNAALGYAGDRNTPTTNVFPLRVALFLVSMGTKLIVSLRSSRVRSNFGRVSTKRDDWLGLPVKDPSAGPEVGK